MRQRTTILLPLGQGVDPRSIAVDEASLTVEAPGASIEERATWSLDELPDELAEVLRHSHELHIRWTREQAFNHLLPFVSRLPAGLHVTYTPHDQKQDDVLCAGLYSVFGSNLKCKNIDQSFTKPPILSERFAHVATFQYYQTLPDIQPLKHYIENSICQAASNLDQRKACERYAQALQEAASIDIDYDAISHAITFSAFFPSIQARSGLSKHSTQVLVPRIDPNDRVEVGILSSETADEPEELKLGGFLAVLGEDKKASATLFSFPSRHHSLPTGDLSSFNASFSHPTGLHPTLELSFPRDSLRPPQRSCRLHAYLTLPSPLFVDRYQLSEHDLLATSNLAALRALSGAEDLEAPEWAVSQWGSASLFELLDPSTAKGVDPYEGSWKVQIPLHLRYLQAIPNSETPYRDLNVPWPITFWACEAEDGLKMATNPFDRVNLGFDGLFGPKTMFYHIAPGQQTLSIGLTVPVLQSGHSSWLQTLTFATVALGFGWVLVSLFMPLQRKGSQHQKKE